MFQAIWRTTQPVLPVLIGITLIDVALGILMPLIGIQLARWGVSEIVVGVAASAYFVGFLAGTVVCQRIIRRVGHIRAFGVFVVLAADATVLHLVIQDAYFWIGLRAIAGFSLAGGFVVIESWLNDKSTDETRSRIFAIYTAVSWGASGISPLLLNVEDPTGILLFAFCTLCLASAMIPLGLTKIGNPVISEHTHLSLRRLFKISPLGVVCCFGAGFLNGSLYGLLPAFVDAMAMGERELSFLLLIGTIAVLIAQFPIGHAADVHGRRPIIIGTVTASALLCLMVYATPEMPYIFLLVIFFLLSAFQSPLYALGIGQTSDYIARKDFVAASSGLLFAWGLGASIGPSLAGIAMHELGPRALFLFVGCGYGLIVAFALYRVLRRKAKTPEEQNNYVAVPAVQGAYGAPELDPRGEHMPHVGAKPMSD
ncbi:MFS transporter [Dongia mobilis]|jgi:MFS family permease|uniref:MFS transporter n=1 Tax=Dongia sp. TaxID=1977262 RepID=UPI0026EA05A8